MKDWKYWSISFDNALTQEIIVSIFEDVSDIPYNKLIGSLFNPKIDLNKFIVETKIVMDAK